LCCNIIIVIIAVVVIGGGGGGVARNVEMKNTHKTLVGNPEGKTSLERTRRRF